MKLRKKIISTVVASTLALGSVSFAANFDIKNQETDKVTEFLDYMTDSNTFLDLATTEGKYLVEFGDKWYDATKAIELTQGGKTLEQIVSDGSITPIGDVTSELKVESVSAINAKQIKVTFSKPVDVDTVIKNAGTDDTLVAANFTFADLDSSPITANTAVGKLSKDGKVLTITAASTELFKGRYDITIDGIKDKSGNLIDKYTVKNLDFSEDKVAPTILATEQVSSNKVKIKFSEPVVFSAGALTAKYADSTLAPALVASDLKVGGTNLTSLASLASAPVTEVEINIVGATVKENKNIVVTLNGVADTAGNLLNPQPATTTIVKLPIDGVEPAITTVTQTGAKKFTIKFNKDLDGTTLAASDVTVGGNTASSIKKISASEYEFTMLVNLDGLQTVSVAANKAVDLAGQDNSTVLSKVVTFKVDAEAPVATAKLVKDKNNKEVIQLTFNKDVTTGNVTVAGEQVKDYVTTTGISETVAVVYADGTGTNKKVLNVPLSAAALAVEEAAYDVKISSTVVKSDTGVDMKDVEVKFTRGKDGQADNVNADIISNVSVAPGADNNKVDVTFTIPNGASLDGATATNVANYSVAGAQIESVTLVSAIGTSQVATLNLKENSNTFTGVRNITIKNVKVSGSTKVMEPKTITNVSLKENVRPTVTKSEVTKITQAVAGSAAVPGTAITSGANDSIVTLSNETSANATESETFTIQSSGEVHNAAGVSEVTLTGSTGSYAGSFVYNGVNVDIAGGSDDDTFTVTTTAAVSGASGTSAETEVALTFSENVVPGSNTDFELFIGGEKVTATVATSATSNDDQLKVTIDKALTTADFAKGVQLKATTTLDIADSVGNELKLDAPINLKLN